MLIRFKLNSLKFYCGYIPLLVTLFLLGCSNNRTLPNRRNCPDYGVPCLQGKAIIELKTNRGIILLELNGDLAPVTAGNFTDLVKRGVYDGTLFHRVVNVPLPFVAQGGDPLTKRKNVSRSSYGRGSYIDQISGEPRLIPLEIKLKKEPYPRYGELLTNPNDLSRLELKHEKASIAMARSQSLNSASAQFYISLRRLPELDGRYSVFGRVIRGIDVVDQIHQGDKVIKAKILKP